MRRNLAALVIALAGAAPGVPPPAADAAARAPADLLVVSQEAVWISPDGDGRQDRVSVGLRLTRAATVGVVVKRGDDVVDRYAVGSLSAGDHVWRWDGTVDGKVVRDGRYHLVVQAHRGEDSGRADVKVVVDTAPNHGTLTTTRSTVYPMATAVPDRVLVQYLREGWDAQAQADLELLPLEVRFEVVAPDGSVVVRRHVEHEHTVRFEWYGRSAGGQPVPEGAYVVRARVLDPAGNVSRFHRPIRVSHQQLRPEVTSSTITASAATPFSFAYPGSCLGCGDYCTPSTTGAGFPGGIALGCEYFQTIGTYVASVPFDVAPVDASRVTAVGLPHVPGSPALARVDQQGMGPGPDTATTPWRPVSVSYQPFLPDLHTPVIWTVSTDLKNYYDFASFTIEYRRWVPVEG